MIRFTYRYFPAKRSIYRHQNPEHRAWGFFVACKINTSHLISNTNNIKLASPTRALIENAHIIKPSIIKPSIIINPSIIM